jgi:hypothetical protein
VTGTPVATQSIHELFAHIGFRDYRNADGDLVVELPVAPHVMNTNGGLQGGLLATLVDIVGLGDEELCAIATVSFATVPRGTGHSNGTETENE